ncbi:centromere-associated protein E isoform X2 [Parasteatoda tepidariorum]|uniref:centromere-associated protein E isoform X2 n=1 Tax=Parasteatoda tepidariorum TaxID=114398 RepID=UPI0039BC2DCB
MEKAKLGKSFSLEVHKSRPSDLISFDENSPRFCEDLTLGKENDKNVLNESLCHSKSLEETLQDKIKSQEAIIKDLKSKLELQSHSEDYMNVSALATPAKTKKDTSLFSGRENFSFFDGFTSTPAKNNKERVLKHQSDATVVDSGNDKNTALENRLKQLCQELDCQRHNFEATKNAMELKFKESENILKTDLKFQVQACASVEKELNELRNKYQQETSQSSKKLDMITLQLNKSEQLKTQYEQEIKRLETKLNDSEQILRKKEEEFQELQKLKNVADMTCQSLQALKSDLEKKCNSSLKENMMLNDQISSSKIELEKNVNLLKEKDLCLCNMKKEMDSISHSCNNLEGKIKELDNKLRASEADYANLTNKFEKLVDSENSLKSLSEKLEKERAQLQNNLKEENSKSQRLELNAQKLEKNIQTLQNQLENKVLELNGLNDETKLAKEKYEGKIKELDNKLRASVTDYANLTNKFDKLMASENSLKSLSEKLEKEKAQLQNNLKEENSKSQQLELNAQKLGKDIQTLQSQLENKVLELNGLNDDTKLAKEKYEGKIKELDNKLRASETDYANLTNKFDKLVTSENSLKSLSEKLENEKAQLQNNLKEENSKSQQLELNAQKLEKDIQTLQSQLENKVLELNGLNDEMKLTKEKYDETIKEMEAKIADTQAEVSNTSKEVERLTNEKSSLENLLENLEKREKNINDQLFTETEKNKALSLEIDELKRNVEELNKNLTIKQEQTLKLSENLTKEYEIASQELQNKTEELSAMQKEIKDLAEMQSSLEKSLALLEAEKTEVSEKLAVEVEKNKSILSEGENLQRKILKLEEIILQKTNNIQKLDGNNKKYEVEMENLSAKNSTLEKKNEALFEKNEQLSSDLESQKKIISSLNEEIRNKVNEMKDLEEKSSTVDKYKHEVQNLSVKCSTLEEEKKMLLEQNEMFSNSLEEQSSIISCKVDEINELKAKKSLEEKYELDNKKLQVELSTLSESIETLKLQIEKQTLKETSLGEQLSQVMSEKEALVLQLQQLKESNMSLSNELSFTTLKINDLNEGKESLINQYETRIQTLEAEYDNAQKEINSLNFQLKELGDSELLLKGSIASLQQENLLLSETLNQNAGEIQSLMSLKEEISKQSSEICHLKEILIDAEKDYKASLENALSEKMSLSCQLEESSLIIKESLEKKGFLEEEKLTLTDLLKKEGQKCEMLEIEVAQLKQSIFWIGEDLAQINISAVQAELQYQDKIRGLESSLLETQNDLSILRTELENSQLKELHLSKLLDEESNKIEKYLKLEEKSEELKNKISLHESNLAAKSQSLHEANEKISLITSEYEASLENALSEKMSLSCQLEESSLIIKESLEKVGILEEEKLTLTDLLKKEGQKCEMLEMEVAQLKQSIFWIGEDLAQINISAVQAELQYQDKIRGLETSLLETQNDLTVLRTELENSQLKELHLSKLLDEESNKSEKCLKLEEKSEELKNKISLQESNLVAKSQSLHEANEKISLITSEYEEKIEACKNKLSLTLEEYQVMKSLLEESLLNEDALKEKIIIFQNEKADLENKILAEVEKNISLEAEEKKNAEKIAELENKLYIISIDLEKERKALLEKELEISELESKLESTQSELQQSFDQLQETICNEKTLKEKLCLVENEHSELAKSLEAQSDKIKMLETTLLEIKEKMMLLDNDLMVKSLELEKCQKQLTTSVCNEDLILEMTDKLKDSRVLYETIQNRLSESLSNEAFYKTEFALLGDEKNKLTSALEDQLEKVSVLEKHIKELKEDLTAKSSELENYKEQLLSSHWELQLDQTLLQLQDSINNECTLKESLSLMEVEKTDLTLSLKTQCEKTKALETTLNEMTEKVNLVNEEQIVKASELEECKKQLTLSIHNEDCLNTKLQSLTSLCESTQCKLSDLIKNEITFKTKISLLEEEKINLISQSNIETEKVLNLEGETAELKDHITTLKEELKLKTTEIEKFGNEHFIIQRPKANEFANGELVDVKIWALSDLNCVHSLENSVMTSFNKYKFLWAYHLLNGEDLEKSEMNVSSLNRIFLLLQEQKAILNFILSISKMKSVSEQLNFLSISSQSNCISDIQLESIVTDNLFNNILKMLCVNSVHILECTTQKIQKCLQNLEQPVSFLESQGNINSSNHHIAITFDTKYILYEYKISSYFSKRNSSPTYQENQYFMWDSTDEKQIKDVLQKLSLKEVSKILDFYAISNDDAVNFFDSENFNPEVLQSVTFLLFHKYNQTRGVEILNELKQWASFRDFLNHCLKSLSCINIKENPCLIGIDSKNFCMKQVEVENNASKSKACVNTSIIEKEKDSLDLKVENTACKNESCLNCSVLKKEKSALELVISKEKEKQKSLNSTIEEIEQDLSDTFVHKCQLQDAIIEVGKMFDHFIKKSIDSSSERVFSSEFFSKTCLCENCIKQDGEIAHSNDTILSAETFASWINKLIEQYGKMKNEKQELIKIVFQETAGYSSETSYQTNDEFQKLEADETEFAVFVEQYKEKVQAFEVLKLEIASKEENIKTLQETIKSQKEILEDARLQSKVYENEVAKLESKIRKYEITESHEPVLIGEKEKLIIDLQQKLKALEKSNDALNLDIEKTEQQIQTLSVSKQKLEDEVNKLSLELSKKNLDIETWKHMYETEKMSKSELMSKIQQLELEKVELKEKFVQFEILNDDAEQNETVLKIQQELQTCQLAESNWKNMYEAEKKHTSEVLSKIEQLEIEKLELEEKLVQIEILNSDMEDDLINLKKLQQEHQTCQSTISNWKNKYEAEKKSASELTSKVQQLEVDLEEKVQQLQIVNDDLKQEVNNLIALQQEHETQKLNASTWKDMYEIEKKSLSELMSNVEQLEIEKMELEQNFKNLQIVNEGLEQDLATFKNLQQDHEVQKSDAITYKDLYENEKKSSSQLSSKLLQLEKEKTEFEEKLKQLQVVNDALKNDVNTLKILQREHEDTLLAKNHSLKEKDHIIQVLQERNNEIESNNVHDSEELNELQNLRSHSKIMSENVSCLEKKVQDTASENILLQDALKEVGNERDELKNKIDSLKLDVVKLTEDLELQNQANSELNKQLEIKKIALLNESELHRSAENAIQVQKETISSLNSSLEEKISQMEHQMQIMKNQTQVMKNQNTKLLENESVSKQAILDLKDHIRTATCSLKELESKYSKLSTENSALLEKRRGMSIISENEEMKQVSHKVKFTENIFNLIEEIVKDFSGSKSIEQIENDLNSIKKLFSQSSDSSNIEELSKSFCDNLKSFFKNYLLNIEEVKLKICAISNSVNYMGQFVDSFSDSDSPKTLHFADNIVDVTFNETLRENLIERAGVSHEQVIKDLQQTQELLENYFSALKTIILKQADNCKDLKSKLDQALSKASTSESQGNSEDFVPKWKFKLVRVSAHRWEQEAIKIQKSLQEIIDNLEKKLKVHAEKIDSLEKEKVKSELELNQRIRTLEEENKMLDEEV